MYLSFIRPLIEYGDIVWDNCSQDDKNHLEAMNIEATRITTGATKYCNLEKLFTEIGWDKLQNRRNMHKLIQYY